MPEKVQKEPLIAEGSFVVEKSKELVYSEGTSNKSYYLELQTSKTSEECQLYSVWGAIRAANPTREWRHYSDRAGAEKDFNSIVKSKTKKGYAEI